jgi:galactokinase
VGSAAAAQIAIGLALRDLAAPGESASGQEPDRTGEGSGAGAAMLGSRRLPFDLSAAGLRLMVIDTQVRGTPQPPVIECAPVQAAAEVLDAGAFEALGPMLTAAHAALACDDVQEIAVSAALEAGALGARMIVDGPGRPVCALLPAERLADVRIGVLGAFARRRFRTPRFLTFSPAGNDSLTTGKRGPPTILVWSTFGWVRRGIRGGCPPPRSTCAASPRRP